MAAAGLGGPRSRAPEAAGAQPARRARAAPRVEMLPAGARSRDPIGGPGGGTERDAGLPDGPTPAVGRAAGKVYLVGGGPGDPELLTLRAARLLAAADAVVYDALVGREVLRMIGREAQRIYVGKQAGRHTLPQAEINALLVRLAREGRQVVRLKGGDPFIFGRGGEELEELAAAGIDFEVVPGITAASGMAAYAGIPLTHRDYAKACIFATGHLKDDSCDLDWPALARPRQTVVIYMGVGALAVICRELVAHGRAPDTPAALVQNATSTAQRSVAGSLAALPELAAAAGIRAPALVVVGEVVALQARLQWFRPQCESSGNLGDIALPAIETGIAVDGGWPI